jgi:hypothetical protein
VLEGLKSSIDLITSCRGIVQNHTGTRDVTEHLTLRVEAADHVVQQDALATLLHARSTRDDDQWRSLSIGTLDGVNDLRSPDAVGSNNTAHAIDPSIGIGSKARMVLIGVVNDFDFLVVPKFFVKIQHIVARDTEHMLNTSVFQSFNEKS